MPKTLTAADAYELLGTAQALVDDVWRYDSDAEEDGNWSVSKATYDALSDLVAKLTQE